MRKLATIRSIDAINAIPDADAIEVATVGGWAEAKSTLNAQAEREGLVFKCLQDPRIHFKAISNRFLLKGGS